MRLPKGYGTITKLSGNRRRPFWVRLGCEYSSDGKKLTEIRPTLGYYETRAEALEALHAFHKNPFDITNKSTFAEIYEKWLCEKSQKVSNTTIKSYRSAMKHCRTLWDRPLSELRLADFQAVMDSIGNASASTVTNVKIVLSGVSAYGMRYELISKDYTQYLTASHAENKGKHRPFTAAEIQSLWEMPQSMERDISIILLYTGWRISELLEMPSESIDMAAMTMTGGKKTRASKNRIVPIHTRIRDIVAKYVSKPLPFGMRYAVYAEWLKEHTGHTPHDTRHTFITELQNRGADHICIQRLAGHASDNITDKVYTHKDIAQLRQTVELISYEDIQPLAV